MSREVIVHIGTMKTGSTALQTVLADNRAAMVAQGAFYPASPGPKAHPLLTVAAAADHRVHQFVESSLWKGVEPAARIAQFRREFVAEMEALPDAVDRVIFSDERLSFMLRPEDIERLGQMLRPYFDRVTIVCYLRRQDHYLASRYAEQLRTGQIREPDHLHRKGALLREYDFGSLINRWADVFGHTSIRPRIYETTEAGRFDSVRDFLDLCNLQFPAPRREKTKSNRSSMNLAGQQVLIEIGAKLQSEQNVKQVKSPVWSTLTQAVTAALPGRGWQPTRQEASDFVEQYADGNESIRQRWYPQRASLFSQDFSDLPETPPVMSDADKFAAACDVVLRAVTDAVKQDQRNVRHNLANARQTGDRDKALVLLRRRLRRDGADLDARVQLAELYLDESNFTEARNVLEAAARMAPDHKAVKQLAMRLEASTA